MRKKREGQPRSERLAAPKKSSPNAAAGLGPLLETFSRSEIESGMVPRRRGRDLDRSGLTANDVIDRLGEALLEASLARLLRTARDRAGLTLAELAERLDVSRGRVHQLERDGANLELGTVGRLASALGYEARIAFVPRDPAMSTTLIAPVPKIDDGH